MASIAQGLGVAAGSVTNFLGWWREELRGLVPPRGRARAASQIRIVVGQDGYRVLESTGSKQRPVRGGVELSAPEAAAAAAELAKSNAAALIGIRVPLASCFVRHVELPRSAQADVARILELDLERATPIRRGGVCGRGVGEAGRGGGGGERVGQKKNRRAVGGPFCADSHARGGRVPLLCWGGGGRPPPPTKIFLPPQKRAPPRRRK